MSDVEQVATPVEERKMDTNRLYVRWNISDESLASMFSKYGTITEARVVRTSNRANARSNSFGFVKFEKDEEAAAALAGMQGETFTTEPLVVEYANPAGSSDGNRNRARRGRGNGRRRNNKSDDAEVVEETSGTVTDDEMPTAREE